MLYGSSGEFKLNLAGWVGMLRSSRFSEKWCLDSGEGPPLAPRDGGLLCTGFVQLSADGRHVEPLPLLA